MVCYVAEMDFVQAKRSVADMTKAEFVHTVEFNLADMVCSGR